MTIKYHKPLANGELDFHISILSQIIEQNTVVLDTNANDGYYSLIMSQCVGNDGKIIAFEANSTTYQILSNNIESSNINNITAHNCAYSYSYLQQFHGDSVDRIKFIRIGDSKELVALRSLIEQNKPLITISGVDDVDQCYNTLNTLDYIIYDSSPYNNIQDCVGPLDYTEFTYYNNKVTQCNSFICIHKDELAKYNLTNKVLGKTAVLLTGRNDGYKEVERFALHLTKMLDTFDEVVYIDWNSDGRSFLYEVIDSIPKTNRLKHIVIPPEYAAMMTQYDPKAMPCLTALAANLGLRRTDAEWVVVSTTDIIPPSKEAITNFISKASKNTFYTFSRRDIEYDDVMSHKNDIDAYIKHLNDTTSPRYFPARVTPSDDWSIINCCGDFQLATKNIWNKIRGFEEMMLYACFVDTNVQKKAVLNGFELTPIYDIPLYHMSHKGMANDGSSPSKQHYNNAYEWVEYFQPHKHYNDALILSKNADTWGFSNVDIEYEMI